MELFPIEAEIVEALHRAASQIEIAGKWSDTKYWTKKLKESLRDLGREKGYQVWGTFTDDQEKNFNEWLWDLVWAKCERDDWRRMNGLALACEIEWDNKSDSVLEDFLKLTVSKADWRLFVFTLKKGKSDNQFALLRSACPGSQGNRYLAVGFPERPPLDVQFQAWTL